VKDVLRERARGGGTVLMTTHILEVAERMADRIGVIAHGRLIAEGTLDDLRRRVDKQAGTERTAAGGAAANGNASLSNASLGNASLGNASLEDTFLALVAESAEAA
jgi:ABC-type multidrug transport system ATPase subunit